MRLARADWRASAGQPMNTHFTNSLDLTRQGNLTTAATPHPGAGARVWAGTVIVAAGLGLIVLGGCFLYGVLLLVQRGEAGPDAWILQVVLYVMAFACFVGAAALLVLGLWGLARILLQRPAQAPPEL
jgi:hypothetical protein